jgi:hypothetical protein
MITGPADRALPQRYYESYDTDDLEALQSVLHPGRHFQQP